MPAAATQARRQFSVTTPLGKDTLLATSLNADESLSQLFHFNVGVIADVKQDVAFDKLLGQSVTATILYPGTGDKRYFNGICQRVSQGESDINYAHYRLELVPKVWLLTKKQQSRIFQHLTIPEILKVVFQGFDVNYDGIQGTFEKRDFVVQYRETDFDFASRLMEDEGIYYYFKHNDGKHEMTLANTPQGHADVTYKPEVMYKNVNQAPSQDDDFIYDWAKSQEVTSGKVTLWDHTFELPHKHLEAEQQIQDNTTVGGASHKLAVAENSKLEIYDYPGTYAGRFDGVDKGGGDQPAELQKIFTDNKRTTNIRMQELAAASVNAHGTSTCRQFSAGHKFQVKTLGNDGLTAPLKPAGQYVITRVSHSAVMPDEYRSGGTQDFTYRNTFTVMPATTPFRPPRTTYKPTVYGAQTAQVVGPSGEEIFTDKYGRVKVQFHWDREGKRNADSSCWVRVGTLWAGRGWGMIHIPRIGQEVIVDFLEGDPDQPIIVGNVYNADQMPAYPLPEKKTVSYLKTNSSPGGVGFNEFRIEDKKGAEQIFIHGERNQDIRIKNDCMENILHDRHLTVGDTVEGKKAGKQNEHVLVDKNLTVDHDQNEQIGSIYNLRVGGIDGKGDWNIIVDQDKKEVIKRNYHLTVLKDLLVKVVGKISLLFGDNVDTRIEGRQTHEVVKDQNTKIGGGKSVEVGGSEKTKISGDQHLEVKSASKTKVGGDLSLNVTGKVQEKSGGNFAHESGGEIHLKGATKVIIEAGMQVTLKGPGGFVDVGPAGVTIQGTMVLINSGGSAGSGSGSSPEAPEGPAGVNRPAEATKPTEVKPVVPTAADNAKTGRKSCD